jgi:hypothetical protein
VRQAPAVAGLARLSPYGRAALLGAVVLTLYLLVLVRGLGWQWREVVVGPDEVPPPVSREPVAAVQRALPAAPAAGQPSSAAGAPAPGTGQAGNVVTGAAKTPLPPSDVPPPRNATDERGVTYDAAGVAVMGIDADTGGVYNVAPGRQVRIGGPAGQLFDVQPGGKLTPATRIKEWPG